MEISTGRGILTDVLELDDYWSVGQSYQIKNYRDKVENENMFKLADPVLVVVVVMCVIISKLRIRNRS